MNDWGRKRGHSVPQYKQLVRMAPRATAQPLRYEK
jgi:hypothetical protein